jgi:hypothetical protein
MRTDSLIKAASAFDEAYDRILEDESIRYAIGAMQQLDPDYNANTFAEGDRIKSQLDKGLNAQGETAEFEYQGSVTNNTHVKVHSDLDLLTISTEFYNIEPPGKVINRYTGDPLAELKSLRRSCVKIIKDRFPAVRVDETGSKCIALSGGSLRREIDVVIANWWHTTDFQTYPLSIYRGVKVLDIEKSIRQENKPFLHNFRIDNRDKETKGNLRKLIRLLKSLKYNTDSEVDISSYDISSIVYSMPDVDLAADSSNELLLVESAKNYLASLAVNEQLRNSLWVPNGTRKIFGEGGATYLGLLSLFREAHDLSEEIKASLAKTFRKVTDARISH